MKLVMSLVVRDDADVLDAQIAYHLNAGVDFVIATDHESRDGSAEILESYASAGYLRRIPESGEARDDAWRTQMARSAAREHEADWLLDAQPDEFWLPRGETLKDVLVAIPPRYGVVQGLVRVFVPRPDDGRPFAERMTVRRTPNVSDDESAGRLDRILRPLYRTSPEIVIGRDRDAALDGRVPLRAWYPIEVLRYPARGPEEAISDEQLAHGLADDSLVVDERLRDALSRLEAAGAEAGSPSPRYALPRDGVGHLALRAPNVVDDVAYAGECAAVREVDFEPLQERIAELEQRIASLEAGFWPRVTRTLSRAVRR